MDQNKDPSLDDLLDEHVTKMSKEFPLLVATPELRAQTKELIADTIRTCRDFLKEVIAENVMENMKALADQDVHAFADEGIDERMKARLDEDAVGAVSTYIARAHAVMLTGLELVLYEDAQIDPDCDECNGEEEFLLGAYGETRGQA